MMPHCKTPIKSRAGMRVSERVRVKKLLGTIEAWLIFRSYINPGKAGIVPLQADCLFGNNNSNKLVRREVEKMPQYKLTYFNGRGRAEVTRQMFKMRDVKFEDIRIDMQNEWKDKKKSTPFKQLPVLEVDGVEICQSLAIERLVASRLGLYGDTDLERARSDMAVGCVEDMLRVILKTGEGTDKEKEEKRQKCATEQLPDMLSCFEQWINPQGFFFDHKKIMWPEISLAHLITFVDVNQIKIELSKYSKISLLKKNVESESHIADWIQKRPKTDF